MAAASRPHEATPFPFSQAGPPRGSAAGPQVPGQAASVFVSHSHRDKLFVKPLCEALEAEGLAVWVDHDTNDLPYGIDFPAEIKQAIERADTFLCVISPDSLRSEWCNGEIAYANTFRKRIIPLVYRDVDLNSVPDSPLKVFVTDHINCLFWKEGDDFVAALRELVEALNTDLEWRKTHTWLLLRAIEWQRREHDAGLLQGRALQEADSALRQATVNGDKRPAPVQVQIDYVEASRKAQYARKRRQMIAAVAGMVVALAVAGYALAEQHRAKMETAEAIRQRGIAVQQQGLARSRELAADALGQVTVDPELGVLLAAQAVRQHPLTTQATDALNTTLSASRIRLVIRGHGDGVMRATFSPDGRRILTASLDDTARLWDARTGAELAVLAGHTGYVNSAVFNAQGTRIVTASSDGTARLWNAATGALLHVLKGHTASIESAAFSPNGARIVTASDDGTARVWDVASGANVATLRGHTGLPGVAGGAAIVYSAAFSPDGRRVVTAGIDHTARVWDAATGRQLFVLRGHTSYVYRAIYSPDGRRIATAGGDGDVRLWDAATGKLVSVLTGHTSAVYSLAFSRDGKRLLSASNDRTSRVWDVPSGKALAILSGHTDQLWSAAFNADGTRVVTAGNDHTARVWDAATGQELLDLRGHQDVVYDAEFSPDGNSVVTASLDKTARVWDVRTGRLLSSWRRRSVPFAAYSTDGRYVLTAGQTADGNFGTTAWLRDARTGRVLLTLGGHTANVTSLAFDLHNTRVATASLDRTVRVWDIGTGREITLRQPEPIDTVSFSDDGTRLVTGEQHDDAAYVWNLRTRRVVAILRPKGWTGDVYSAEFDHAGDRVVTASSDGRVREWNARTGAQWSRDGQFYPPVTIETQGSVYTAMYSPDGKLLLTSGAGNAVQLWNADSGESVAVLNGHVAPVSNASFSPDGRYIATASQDGTVRVWDVATRQPLDVLDGSTGPLDYAAFSPDGKRIITAALDGTTSIYACDVCLPARAPDRALLARVPAHVTRQLTLAEWKSYLPYAPAPARLRQVRDLFGGVFTGALPLKSAYYDDYVYGYGWDTRDRQGVYVVKKVKASWNAPIPVVLPGTYADATLAVDARLAGPNDASFAGGIYLNCRQSFHGAESGYRLSVYPNSGDLFLVKWVKGKAQPMGPDNGHAQLPASALHRGTAWNRIALSCIGSRIDASINGKLVLSRQDSAYRSGTMWLGTGIDFDNGTRMVEAHFRDLVLDRR